MMFGISVVKMIIYTYYISHCCFVQYKILDVNTSLHSSTVFMHLVSTIMMVIRHAGEVCILVSLHADKYGR